MLVLLEKTATGYRASSGKPLEAETEGATRDDALNRLRDVMTRKLQGEVEIVDLEIPAETSPKQNPWLKIHGVFKDDPMFDEWQAAIAENRRIENEADGIFPERNP